MTTRYRKSDNYRKRNVEEKQVIDTQNKAKKIKNVTLQGAIEKSLLLI